MKNDYIVVFIYILVVIIKLTFQQVLIRQYDKYTVGTCTRERQSRHETRRVCA